MISSPVNNLYYSAALYLMHQVEQRGQAYDNHSSLLYPQVDPALPNHTVYASPFKQWVYDMSISGSNVPTGLYVNNIFCNKGVSGLKIDYLNGRAIFSGGSTYSNLQVSGAYSVKNFNWYPTSRSDEELVFETKFELNPSYQRVLSGIDKNALVVPGIFITNVNSTNEPFQFGGTVETCINLHCLIIADSVDQLNAVGNLLIDQKLCNFPVVGESNLPLNYYGDFKTGLGNYNYLTLAAQFPNNQGFIEDVDFYKMTNKDFGNRYPDLKCGMADFSIKQIRQLNHSIT